MSIKSILKKLIKPSKIKAVGVIAFLILSAGISTSIYSNASASGTCSQKDPSNDVIYCGVNSVGTKTTAGSLIYQYYNGDGVNSAKSVQDIYSWYSDNGQNGGHITSTDIDNMSTDAYGGYVTKSGDVYLNNTANPAYPGGLVATGAITGGRGDIDGAASQEHIINGTKFWSRAPSVSFLQDSLSAFIVMKDNVFQFAILTSCGNAVKANAVAQVKPPVVKPPVVKTPNYTITKSVSYQGKGWVNQVTAPVDGEVQYKIVVASTGTAPVTHVFVKDAISANIQYTAGTLKENGNPVGDASAKDFFNGGLQIAGLNPGDSTQFTFDAKVGVLYTTKNCKAGPFVNNAFVNATGLPQKGANAYVQEKCTTTPSTPTLTCNELTAATTDGLDYTFTATASATKATITEYVFDYYNSSNKLLKSIPVKTSADTANTKYTFSPGTYNIIVRVNAKAGTRTLTATSPDCAKTITASSSPLCTAPNGNTYPQGSPLCTPTTSTCTTPSGQTVPAGSSACTPGSTCTSPTGQTYPAGSTECNTTPSTLVNTGPGNVIALFCGTTLAGAIGHWYFNYRKAKRALGIR